MSSNPHNPVQWQQALGFSRQSCARVFRDGGTAIDALTAFEVDVEGIGTNDWSRAVDLIASALCRRPLALAA
jgi:hypothetical protein